LKNLFRFEVVRRLALAMRSISPDCAPSLAASSALTRDRDAATLIPAAWIRAMASSGESVSQSDCT
jgi:hypothetical protein